MTELVFYYHKDLQKISDLKLEYLKNQVIKLKNIPQPVQKSPEWYEMRNGMLTASDWGTILGLNHYSNSNSVVIKKCSPDATFPANAAMMWGNKYENAAVSVYEHRNNVEIIDFGCIQHPFLPFLGASPDGITKDGIMLEIKCPSSRKITGTPPEHYWCQVQGQLEVCDLDRCDFIECSFKEYENEEEYLEDNYLDNFLLNKLGHEKGVIVEFHRKKEKNSYYDYSPVSIIGEDLIKWKIDIVKKHTENDPNICWPLFYYWRLEEVSCVPIYRNQEWFNTAKVELESCWNRILKYRELGVDKLKADIQFEKDEKKENKSLLKEKEKKEKEKKEKEDSKPKKAVKKSLEPIKPTRSKRKASLIIDYFDDFSITNDSTEPMKISSDKSDLSNESDESSDDNFTSNSYLFSDV